MGLVHNKQFHIGADYFSGSPSLEEKASLKAMFSEKNLLKQKTLKGQSMSWPLGVHNELRSFDRFQVYSFAKSVLARFALGMTGRFGEQLFALKGAGD